MITAGDLKHRFKVEVNRRTVDDQGGFNSEWEVLGYFWAKVENKSLRSKNEHGEYINTQDMIVHMRQKQRFDISPMTTRDYRLTDKRGNMYSIVNFEQSNFALDFYALSVVQAGHTNEPFTAAPNPCAGATQSIQINSLDGEYDVYLADEFLISGNYGVIFEQLLFSDSIVFDADGIMMSYRDDTVSLRFERTDASTIDFDALDNPTAVLSGNTLRFCLEGSPLEGSLLVFDFIPALSAPDEDGFRTISLNEAPDFQRRIVAINGYEFILPEIAHEDDFFSVFFGSYIDNYLQVQYRTIGLDTGFYRVTNVDDVLQYELIEGITAIAGDLITVQINESAVIINGVSVETPVNFALLGGYIGGLDVFGNLSGVLVRGD